MPRLFAIALAALLALAPLVACSDPAYSGGGVRAGCPDPNCAAYTGSNP